MTDHFTLTGDTAMPNVTTKSLGRDRSKLSSDKAIAWREDLAQRMQEENIPFLSTSTIKIRSKYSPTPFPVTAYHRPNGTVLVWRIKTRLLTPDRMNDSYWNCTAELPFTGATYYPFRSVTGGAA
jgi:hypothetical protein